MRGLDLQGLTPSSRATKRGFRHSGMALIAESQGTTLRDAVWHAVYVTDVFRFRPLMNKIQAELWGTGPYPSRITVEVQRLNQDDIVEIEGTFYASASKAAAQPASPSLVQDAGARGSDQADQNGAPRSADRTGG